MKERLRAYMSGALTGLNDEARQRQLERYELIQRTCAAEGYDCYCPHQHSDPVRDQHMTPAEVHQLDSTNVRNSDLIIADCTEPSFGVGIEAQMADEDETPILLIAQQGKKVSRLIRGIPNVVKFGSDADMIIFPNDQVLARRLSEELRALRPRFVEGRRRRIEQAASVAALAEYAQTRKITHDRYCQLEAAIAAVGAKRPTTVQEWAQLDQELD
ncbi:MAG TPA: hypothetical protein VGX97_03320 [bacterium]|nr:hypothetical protein [bacterium]